jgi:uncharacterized protein
MTNFHFSPRRNRAHEIHWREWGPDIFAEAQQQDKPILLDIGAVWCHWCHVMDETTYSDPQVIQLISSRFIPVRVDNDQRPDVNRRYNLGGWPTTAFLTPGGEVMTGGTYIPPQQMRGYLYQVSEAYRQDKANILEKVREVELKREAARAQPATSGTLTDEIVQNVAREVIDNFDTLYGGFGDEPKFYHPDALELALAHYFISRDEDYLPVVTITLTKMAHGGVYDPVAGGFFRYSTTRDWKLPHFEKLLDDNAWLLTLYLRAHQVTGRQLFRDTARSIVGYVSSTLYDVERGYFYGSQDADEHYYALSKEERAKLPAPFVDHNLYTDWNALMVSAYLQAAQVLEDASLQQMALRALGTLSEEMFTQDAGMYHFRQVGETPQLPRQLSDQAYTALACLDAYQTTARPTYLTRAGILAEFALNRLFDSERGGFYSEALHPDAPGLLHVPDKPLAENAAMTDALIRLYHLTGEERYHHAAERTLAFFAPDYTRYSFTAASYALAVHRFLHYPLHITIVGGAEGDDARELLHAALKEYAPSRLVELVDPVRDAARLNTLGYPAPRDGAQAYVCVGETCLPPVTEPRQIAEGIARITMHS